MRESQLKEENKGKVYEGEKELTKTKTRTKTKTNRTKDRKSRAGQKRGLINIMPMGSKI